MILGDLLQGRRDRFVLGAKSAGPREGADPDSAGNHRKNLTLSLEAGLRRMRTDCFDQVAEHFAALDVVLSEELLAKLETATGFELGYPHDYVAEAEAQAFGADRMG